MKSTQLLLLNYLEGNLTAEYSQHTLKEKPEQTSDINFYLIKKSDELKKLVIRDFNKTTLNHHLEVLLNEADNIIIENKLYVDEDPCNDLLNESCKIFRREGSCLWKYNISVMNSESLPACFYEKLNNLFELIIKNFDETTLKRISFSE